MNPSVELFRSEVKSHNEEFLKHVLTAACEQVHFGVQQHSFGDACEMVPRQKESVNAIDITFCITHNGFGLVVRHSE